MGGRGIAVKGKDGVKGIGGFEFATYAQAG